MDHSLPNRHKFLPCKRPLIEFYHSFLCTINFIIFGHQLISTLSSLRTPLNQKLSSQCLNISALTCKISYSLLRTAIDCDPAGNYQTSWHRVAVTLKKKQLRFSTVSSRFSSLYHWSRLKKGIACVKGNVKCLFSVILRGLLISQLYCANSQHTSSQSTFTKKVILVQSYVPSKWS